MNTVDSLQLIHCLVSDDQHEINYFFSKSFAKFNFITCIHDLAPPTIERGVIPGKHRKARHVGCIPVAAAARTDHLKD